MDEPCAALDPISTLRIEELMRELRGTVTIIIVTHNLQQAARVSDYTAFMLMGEGRAGELVELGRTDEMFKDPVDKRTEDYITGTIRMSAANSSEHTHVDPPAGPAGRVGRDPRGHRRAHQAG